MVDEYAAWYDRHHDRAWQEMLLAPPDGRRRRAPWAFVVPRTPADLRAMGRAYAATIFLTAGNVTHTPAYGNLIALGIHDVVRTARRLAGAGRTPRRYRERHRAHRALPHVLGGRGHHRLPAARRIRRSAPRSAWSGRPTPGSC